MIKEVPVGSLLPNPYRRLDEYPIVREKVDTLRESLRATGYWGNISARPAGKKYEIAFGHHRLIALQEEFGEKALVEVNVKELTNEQMLKMMARENSQEYGSSAWVEMETLRAVIDAYGKGEIQLPAVPEKTPQKHIRYVPTGSLEHPYTKSSVAEFIGWINNNSKADTVQPNHACEVAFKAMDMIDEGFLRESDLKGLQREHVNQLVTSQWAIYQTNMRQSQAALKDAEAAEKAAQEAEDARTRKRLEKKAEALRDQSVQSATKAEADAKDFGKEGARLLRSGASVREIRDMAEERKPSVITKPRSVDADGFVRKSLIPIVEKIADEDGSLFKGMNSLRSFIDDVSGDALAELDKEIAAACARLQAMRKCLKVSV